MTGMATIKFIKLLEKLLKKEKKKHFSIQAIHI